MTISETITKFDSLSDEEQTIWANYYNHCHNNDGISKEKFCNHFNITLERLNLIITEEMD